MPAKKAAKKAPKKAAKPKTQLVTNRNGFTEPVDGPLPLSPFDYQFCLAFVQTGKQAEAFRQVRPDAKDPATAGYRMMQRREIREHVRAIYAEITKERDRAAKMAARSALLTLEVADDRLMEVLGQRRFTQAEAMAKATGVLELLDAKPTLDEIATAVDNGEDAPTVSAEFKATMAGPAAVDDATLLKAVDLAYKRKGGILKAEKPPEATNVQVMLYKPAWYGSEAPKTIEGE